MDVEWTGQVARAESVAAGTCVLFFFRKETHLGIRADDERARGTLKGLVSLTTGYNESASQPSFFDLAALGTKVVYSIPDAALVLPTERGHIHPGRYALDWGPGALAQDANQLFLGVAYNSGMRFLKFADGTLVKEWPVSDEIVWFSKWSIIRRLRENAKLQFDFTFGS